MALVHAGGALRAVWRDALASVLLVMVLGLSVGLFTGLIVVHVLALLGLHVETGTSVLLHRVLGG
jgi:hypothetical protein